MLALVVDHRLRPDATDEAEQTRRRLEMRGIAAKVLTIQGLHRGAGLADRARRARLSTLAAACTDVGITDLLLGHHAGDQAETLMMRALSGSGPAGFAGIPSQRETHAIRVLRPLLAVPPVRLRAMLTAAGVAWVEDPSNQDRQALRGRLRGLPTGNTDRLLAAATAAGTRRAADETRIAEILARRACLYPEGYALLSAGPLPPGALAALLRTISGAAYPIAEWRLAGLAAAPAPATIAGVRLMRAGRHGPDGALLLVREAAAMAPPVPATAGALWDRRFRLASPGIDGAIIGPLGADAARWRHHPRLPSAVLYTLPAIRRDGILVSAPFVGYGEPAGAVPRLQFCPAHPAAGAPWR